MENKASTDFTVSAPGKVILFGEHSVVYGKIALAASLSLRSSAHFSESGNNNDTLNIVLPKINLKQSYNVTDLNKFIVECPPPLLHGTYSDFNLTNPEAIDATEFISKLREYINKAEKGKVRLDGSQELSLIAFLFVLCGMFSSVNVKLTPFTIDILTDLVIGAGTGSSASFGVCLAAAFYQYLRKRIATENKSGSDISRDGFNGTVVVVTDLSVFDQEELNIILGWAMVSDKVMHGNPSGIDATVSTFGNIIKYKRGEAGSPSTITRLAVADSLKILLVNSCVTRNTKRMVAEVASRRGRFPKVLDTVLDAMEEIAVAAEEVFNELGQQTETKTEVDSLVAKLGELIEMNQSLLCSLGVSHRTLDDICSVAKERGLSAKLTGAGGGGYAYVLIPPNVEASTITALQTELGKRGYEATLAHLGGAGLVLQN